MISALQTVNVALPWFFPALIFVMGACVGSFLNVCILRLPRGETVVTPGSHCACGRPVAWHDNLPILGWFLLRGRARCCGRPFSFRYPVVELLTAVLFTLSWRLFPVEQAVGGMVLVALVIAATFIDLDHLMIPDGLTLGGAVAGVLLSLALPGLQGVAADFVPLAALRAGLASGLGVLIGSGLVLWVSLLAEAVLKKEAMGFGDVKFLGALGAFIGWKGAVFAFFGGAVLGCAGVAALLFWQQLSGRRSPLTPRLESADGIPADRLAFGVRISFGPMLGAGALLYFFLTRPSVDAYFDRLGVLF